MLPSEKVQAFSQFLYREDTMFESFTGGKSRFYHCKMSDSLGSRADEDSGHASAGQANPSDSDEFL